MLWPPQLGDSLTTRLVVVGLLVKAYPRVEDYMSTPVVVAKPSDTIARVRNLMIRHRLGRIVIVDDAGKPVGIITKNDLLRLAEAGISKRPLDSILAEEVMTRDLIVIPYSKSVREAARLMLRHNISGLPVVDDDGRLVGIITKTDIVRTYAERVKGRHKAKDYMYTDPPQVSRQHTMFHVI